MQYEQILRKMKSLENPGNVEGMARFGINPKGTLGVSMPELKELGKQIGKDHSIAIKLWDSGIHEARILAALVDEPIKVTESQMERWVSLFDSWDVCDQVCMNLFDKTPFAHNKALEWSSRKGEFEKRAGFALMAVLAVHDKKTRDEDFLRFLPAIKRESRDERNYVRKSVNWALRQIGKRNMSLNREAIKAAQEIGKMDSKAARWIAKDALRELRSPVVRERLERWEKRKR
jgi:3-methyladenine DNA glycosylase AlkD